MMTTTNAVAAITPTTSVFDDNLGLTTGVGLGLGGSGSVSDIGHCQQADDLLDFLLNDNGGSLVVGSMGTGCDQLFKSTIEEKKDGEGEAWSCAACTFVNHPDLMSCEVCGTDRAGDGSDQSRRIHSTSSSLSSEQILDPGMRSGSTSGLGLDLGLAPRRLGYSTTGGLNDVMTGDMLLDDLLSGNLDGNGTSVSLGTEARVMGIDDVVDDLLNDLLLVGNKQGSSDVEATLPPAWTASAILSSSSSHLPVQSLALSPYSCSKVTYKTQPL